MSPRVAPGATTSRRSPVQAAAAAPAPRKPTRLMYVLAGVIWAHVWRIQDAFPFLGKIKLPLLLLVAAVALFVARGNPVRRLEGLRGRIPMLVLALLVLMVLSVPGSLWPGKSASFLLYDFLPTVTAAALVAATIRDTRDVEWYLRVSLGGALFYALFTLLFFDPGSGGRLGNLIYYDSNDFALLLVCMLPVAVFFARNGLRRRTRLVALFAAALFIMMLVQSGSRGGFLALCAVLIFILLRFTTIPARVRLGAVVGGAAVLLVAASDEYWGMMSTMLDPKSDYNYTEVDGRKQVWERGLSYMAQRPLFGVGVRNFPQAEGQLSEIGRRYAAEGRGFKWSVAHNSFLEIGAEMGVAALLAFVAMLGSAVAQLRRIARRRDPLTRRPDRTAVLAQALIAAFLGYVVAGFFVSAEYFGFLYIVLLAPVVGLARVTAGQPQPAAAPAARRAPVPRRAMPAGASALRRPA